MPPKRRPPRGATPPPKNKQKTLASFFSPTKAAAREVIDLVDSDSDGGIEVLESEVLGREMKRELEGKGKRKVEVEVDGESDEAMARRLAAEWGAEDAVDVEAVKVDIANGVSGSTSAAASGSGKPGVAQTNGPSILDSDVIEVADDSPVKHEKAEPLHPMFKREPESKFGTQSSQAGPSKPKTVFGTKSAPKEAAPAIDFDVDSFLFRPESVDVSLWPGGRLPYSVFVGVYVQVAATRSRLTIVRVLTNFLHLLLAVSPLDLAHTMYLLSNHLRPSYLPCELGVGSMILSKAIKEVSGLQAKDLKLLWSKHGDPGDVAYEAKSNLRTIVAPAPLIAHDVYTRLLSLSRISGTQSGKIKGDVVRKLMVQARGEEVRYIVRSLIGNLRIGAVRLTLLTALARAAALHVYPDSELGKVLPLPDKGKKPLDPAREAAEAACVRATRLVRRVYVRHPNYADLVAGILDGLEDLEARVPLSVGIPISPMLGSITRSIDEVYARLGSLPFTAEEKLDGQRLQMHVRAGGPQGDDDGGRWVEGDAGRVWVRLFSRHLEDMTDKYPDVCTMALALLSRPMPATRAPFPPTAVPPEPTVASLLDTEGVTSLILDAEIVAIDADTGAKRTFQELTNRAKKDVKVEDIKVVVQVCAFDLMLLNDVPLLSSSFAHRRHLLRTLLPPLSGDPRVARFAHVDSVDSAALATPAGLRAFFDTVVERKAEGVMVKLLEGAVGVDDDEDEDEDEPKSRNKAAEQDKKQSRKKALPATYEPDQRSMGWLKVKKGQLKAVAGLMADYLEGLGDSLDLVPVGAWWGMGRKAGWWSPILLAARNPDSGALEAVCKCISGFTDAFYKDLLVRYPPEGDPEMCTPRGTAPLGYVETGVVPEVWFKPSEVWEIRGADITLSPVYTAGASYIGGERGLSLRFPRFIRRRDDKSIDEATTSEEFADMFRRQMARPPDRAVVRAGSEEAEGDGNGAEAEAGEDEVGEEEEEMEV